MEIIASVDTVRNKTHIVFESGWQVWLDKKLLPGFPLQEGTQVNRESFTKFILLHQYPAALNRAVSLLAQRARSKAEIESRLKLSHYDEEVINLVLYKLEKEGFLNDQEFAEQWIESRMKKYGPARIRQELKIKGVDAETADASMLACSEESQLEAAVSASRKKIRSASSAADLPKLFRQVTGMLVRRGFSWETAKKAYDIAIQEPEE